MDNQYKYKLSIVMTYHNGKSQIITTLNTIAKSKNINIEVVIVDDGSRDEHRLNDIIYNYPFRIQLLRIEPEDKKWHNPCIAYNLGFKHAHGEIIIIQNSEVCHIGDIVSYTMDNLKDDQYLVYSCYALPSLDHNIALDKIMLELTETNLLNRVDEYISKINYNDYLFDWNFYVNQYDDLKHIKTFEDALNHWNATGNKQNRKCNQAGIIQPVEYVQWKGWYNHPSHHPRPLHFISAVHKKNIDLIRGFDENYSQGYWYDDDDFLERIAIITNVNIVDAVNIYGIHQYHNDDSADMIKNKMEFEILCEKNKCTYNMLLKQNKNGTKIYNWTPTIAPVNPKYHVFNNFVLDDKIIGLGITTYSDDKTSDKRIEIISESLKSLKASLENDTNNYIVVVVVVDGNPTDKHRQILDLYRENFTICYKPINTGIGASKNTCIKLLLDRNIDIGFLADDDIIYKKNWYKPYCSYILATDIQHFIYFPLQYISKNTQYKTNNQHKIIDLHDALPGCFITFTQKIIDKIGYFKVLPYRYGHEHGDFTNRCIKEGFCPCRADIYESLHFLELHNDSITNKSIEVDYVGVNENGKAISAINSYVHYCDGL